MPLQRSSNNPEQESQTGVIELNEDNIEHVEVIVRFFYYNNYDVGTSHGDPNFHLSVFKVADKYLLPSLQAVPPAHFTKDVRNCDIEQLATAVLSVYD